MGADCSGSVCFIREIFDVLFIEIKPFAIPLGGLFFFKHSHVLVRNRRSYLFKQILVFSMLLRHLRHIF